MSFKRKVYIPNGDIEVSYLYFTCDRCEQEIGESDPHYESECRTTHFCLDCSFIEGHITSDQYLHSIGLGIFKAAVKDGQIYVWSGKTPPWELTNRDHRKSKEYRTWRQQVLERDDFTCQHCRAKERELNAHHIKPFAEYEELRYEVSNGLTLCIECHKKVHRKDGR